MNDIFLYWPSRTHRDSSDRLPTPNVTKIRTLVRYSKQVMLWLKYYCIIIINIGYSGFIKKISSFLLCVFSVILKWEFSYLLGHLSRHCNLTTAKKGHGHSMVRFIRVRRFSMIFFEIKKKTHTQSTPKWKHVYLTLYLNMS